MRKLALLFLLIVLSSFITSRSPKPVKIRWKKVTTVEQAHGVMDKIILPHSYYDEDMKILACQKHSYLQGYGDTVIYFHSPELSVHFGAIVVRKWMYKFHFEEEKLQSYTVEKGLTGP